MARLRYDPQDPRILVTSQYVRDLLAQADEEVREAERQIRELRSRCSALERAMGMDGPSRCRP